MRALLPRPADHVDLDEVYAFPPQPWVRASMVSSLDGAAWLYDVTEPLSGPADRRVFATLRGLADVVLVGAGTVRAERYGPARPKPERVAVRRAAGQLPAPPIAVVTATLDLDLGTPLFTEATVRPLVLTTQRVPAAARAAAGEVADVLVCGDTAVDLHAALDALAGRGLRWVLCEGGPDLLAQLAATERLDELDLTVAPRLTGGDAGRIVAGPGLDPPVDMCLASVLEEDGFLFLRCLRRGTAG
jgi:riboflavin biosynthesis pyrimidine reductase